MVTVKIKCHPVTFGDVNEKYLKEKRIIVNNLKENEHFDKEISLRIKIYLLKERAEKSDLDNYLKAIIDAINESGIINNESQISLINIQRIKVNSLEDEGMRNEIHHYYTY